jgi:mRNA interferase HigB
MRQNVDVRVISLKRLREFWELHPDAKMPLRAWYKLVLNAEWKNLHDARATFPHADGVRTESGETLTVFNIAGNKYRLIARIRYDYQLVNIRAVLTHAEYDHERWKE